MEEIFSLGCWFFVWLLLFWVYRLARYRSVIALNIVVFLQGLTLLNLNIGFNCFELYHSANQFSCFLEGNKKKKPCEKVNRIKQSYFKMILMIRRFAEFIIYDSLGCNFNWNLNHPSIPSTRPVLPHLMWTHYSHLTLFFLWIIISYFLPQPSLKESSLGNGNYFWFNRVYVILYTVFIFYNNDWTYYNSEIFLENWQTGVYLTVKKWSLMDAKSLTHASNYIKYLIKKAFDLVFAFFFVFFCKCICVYLGWFEGKKRKFDIMLADWIL